MNRSVVKLCLAKTSRGFSHTDASTLAAGRSASDVNLHSLAWLHQAGCHGNRY